MHPHSTHYLSICLNGTSIISGENSPNLLASLLTVTLLLMISLNYILDNMQLPRPIASSLINVFSNNPHAFRISTEHTYTTFVPPTRKRLLPAWLQTSSTAAFPSQQVMQTSPDGVFNYARAVLNDGLFLMAFRDAIHEGDGVRILNCWKFMLTYFFSSGHRKYALEAFYLLACTRGSVTKTGTSNDMEQDS